MALGEWVMPVRLFLCAEQVCLEPIQNMNQVDQGAFSLSHFGDLDWKVLVWVWVLAWL